MGFGNQVLFKCPKIATPVMKPGGIALFFSHFSHQDRNDWYDKAELGFDFKIASQLKDVFGV